MHEWGESQSHRHMIRARANTKNQVDEGSKEKGKGACDAVERADHQDGKSIYGAMVVVIEIS